LTLSPIPRHRPPTPPPFPYTTLFRSLATTPVLMKLAPLGDELGASSAHAKSALPGADAGASTTQAKSALRGEAGESTTRAKSALDRKSTRLNSSHLVISYAVFCLKKK